MRWAIVLLTCCSPIEKVTVDPIEEPGRGSLVGHVHVDRVQPTFAHGRAPWVAAQRIDARTGQTRDLSLVADIDRTGVFVFAGATRGQYALDYVIPTDAGTCVFRATARIDADRVTFADHDFAPKLGDCHACTFVKPDATSCI
jgi:hypothetical protein